MWAAGDRLFPLEHGRRLSELLPRRRFETIPGSRTFIPEEQPERLAAMVRAFMADRMTYAGDDRVTFRLQPGDRLQLVFHRGAKVRADSEDFAFGDSTGLLSWASNDRAMRSFVAISNPHPQGLNQRPAGHDDAGRATPGRSAVRAVPRTSAHGRSACPCAVPSA